jgi:hypothetical protein
MFSMQVLALVSVRVLVLALRRGIPKLAVPKPERNETKEVACGVMVVKV